MISRLAGPYIELQEPKHILRWISCPAESQFHIPAMSNSDSVRPDIDDYLCPEIPDGYIKPVLTTLFEREDANSADASFDR